ncbi:ABC transporter permease [Microbulbifer sp. Q7]|uniref:FtsX-like permease family protein n=1 Tax=Microbulbifer sp. Q7 TaxID=1785091 RepID=UPI00083069FA|nr:ABC transporter permease [Microbulbifer sp. Q7]
MGLAGVFLSHYRRHPGQLVSLLLILVCAAMLWSGVRALTGSAADAVNESRAALEPLLSVVREDGEPLTVEDFVRLRRLGICVSPRLEVRVAAENAPVVVGIDPFSAGCLRQYRERDGNAAGASQAVGRLIEEFDRPTLLGNATDLARWEQHTVTTSAPYLLREASGLPRGELLTDISVAAELAPVGRKSLAILTPAAELQDVGLPPEYRSDVQEYGVEPDPLVDAFLLSLNALGVLALLVAGLLVRAVYRFALEQRRRSLQILARLGVPKGQLNRALLVEVVVVALVGGTLGLWLGELLAGAMASGFQGTLQGLFSVEFYAQRSPGAATWLGMVLILALVVAWAGADLLMTARTDAQWEWHGNPTWRWPLALVVLAGSVTCLLFTETLWLIFAATLGCLVGAGLLLPDMLARILGWLERRCRQPWMGRQRPLLEWSCAEMRALCHLLQLPLIALAFAIATAIAVQSMVTGFETTFDRWLDQRLQGDLYLDPGESVAPEGFTGQLSALPGVTSVLPMVRGRGVLGALPVDVMAVDPASPLVQDWPFLQAAPAHWRAMEQNGVMVNEQLARRRGLTLGDTVTFQLGTVQQTREIVGIYADYGRPEGEIVLALAALPASIPSQYTTFVLATRTPTDTAWRDWPEKYIWLAGSRVRDQAWLKQAANDAFDRTFRMTRLLNLLTLTLAGVALALMGLVIFRLRHGSYTLLHVYGVSRPSLRRRLIAHSMLVTGLLAVLAIPLGVFLGWVLVAKVNPAAFGWALSLHLYPAYWLQVWAACLGIGALVGVLAGNPVRLEGLKNE